MKSNTHPKLHATVVRCHCGNTFETLATVEEMKVEICSNCHPFYTGKQRSIATEGRVERLKRRYEKFNKKDSK